MKKIAYIVALITIAIIVASVLPTSAAVDNGSFETGDLTSWDAYAYDAGAIYAADSVATFDYCAIDFLPDLGNTDGSWVAILDQIESSVNFLTQTMLIDGSTLSLDMTYYNAEEEWAWDGDFFGDNQYMRVDIITATASHTTMNGSDILLTIFESVEGTTPYTAIQQTLSADVSSLIGQTVTLRIAQSVRLFCLPTAIDNVQLSGSVASGAVGYNKIGQVHVAAPGSAIYESAGGGVVRDAGGSEIWVPNPTAHDPSQDTYDVISQTTIDGTTWVEIFNGNVNQSVWLPLTGYVTPIYLP